MKKYYIQLFSPHGLIRYHEPEIGRDKDTGGQVKYVLELLEVLSKHPQVRKVDLFTRKIIDKRVSADYGKGIEPVNDKARIVRIACGGNAYRQKESLWDHLDEYVDRTIKFIEQENDIPDVVHGHYADGIYIAGQLSEMFGMPFFATAHSLGRNKKNILLQQGMPEEKINEKFNMQRRIKEEEQYLKTADAVITSTNYIVEEQYSLYENKAYGKFIVNPPGVNNHIFFPFYRLDMPSYNLTLEQEQALYRVNSEIERFLFQPAKPLVLSIGRADKRKNFETIIQAYGQDKELQAMANLAIFAGVRKDISQMQPDEQEILTNLLLLLDKYDLYGKMAIPKKNDPKFEVPEIYRIAARKKGVFVNATPGENFGLTILEAAGCGLPVIASPTGGPKEIIESNHNGILVDVEDPAAIAAALKKIIADQNLWEQYSANGIKAATQDYSWEAHANKYIELINKVFEDKSTYVHKTAYGKKMSSAQMAFVSDIDGTLFERDDTEGLGELLQWIKNNREKMIFGVASGRNKQLTLDGLHSKGIIDFDVLICSAGSEIYYTDKLIPDNGYENHINRQWKREELKKALESFKGIHLQGPDAQWPFKLSYYVDEDFTRADLQSLYKFLNEQKLRAKILLTENRYLDLLPFRSGKGSAVQYLSNKWKLPLEKFITAGNSGNDIDMVRGKARGIVVANYSAEMQALKNNRQAYFARKPLAKGVLEGIEHYLSQRD
ncbi:HAD-IIB family hydrolase [Parafilimonas sp.]|uniref:HAD-IIB family hydrolase n=1 Tax=Parafilimonas sp. TaxID=1969739 RepID=UPI0039E6B02D